MRSVRVCLFLALMTLSAMSVARAQVVINEIMYNTPGADDVEYVELYNSGATSVDLTNWFLLDDDNLHGRCYLTGTLGPGQYFVVAGFLSRFQATYPGVTNLNPNQFDNTLGTGYSLGNNGDQVRLFNNLGQLRDLVSYSDVPPWPTSPDGNGPSLELKNPVLDNTVATNWGASIPSSPGGTPGAQNSIYAPDQVPVIVTVSRNIPLPDADDVVTLTAQVSDDHAVAFVLAYVNTGAGYVPQNMFDDGLHNDGLAGDTVFGALTGPFANGTLVKYYITATDNVGQSSTNPAAAPGDYYAYTVGYVPPQVFIHEILASNVVGAVDEFGEHEDWLELRNRGVTPINLGGMFLTSNYLLTRKWPLPSVTIPPGGFLVIWCDDEIAEGQLHANFKLDRQGGKVGLFDSVEHGNNLVHGVAFGLQNIDVSFGFWPDDADAPEYIVNPTPGASNNTSTLFSSLVLEEFQTTSAAGGIDDWLVFRNRGAVPIDISGWHLTDDTDFPLKYTFPTRPLIPPGGSVEVTEAALGFGFAQDGSEIILLTNSDGVTGQDFYDYGPQSQDISLGRYPPGTGNWHFFNPPSRFSDNSCDGGLALPAVSNLRFTSRDVMTWNPVASAQDYDVVRGNLSLLKATGGNFTASELRCQENDGRDTATRDPQVPTPGSGYFYVVRAATFSCGYGTYNSGAASQVGSRDAEIAAGSSCP